MNSKAGATPRVQGALAPRGQGLFLPGNARLQPGRWIGRALCAAIPAKNKLISGVQRARLLPSVTGGFFPFGNHSYPSPPLVGSGEGGKRPGVFILAYCAALTEKQKSLSWSRMYNRPLAITG